MPAAKTEATIDIPRVSKSLITLRIVGTAPLIVHRFDEKARQIMLDAQQGRKKAKEVRDPDADFERARHKLADGSGDGFPANGIKAAITGGARYFNDKRLSMTLLRQALFVTGEGPEMLVPIEGATPGSRAVATMHEAMVRVGMGTADVRFRPIYDPWGMTLKVTYVPSLMSLDTVIALVDAGGMGGLGEMRPSKAASGIYGTFSVDDTFDPKVVSLG
jgi:hypothetical protein